MQQRKINRCNKHIDYIDPIKYAESTDAYHGFFYSQYETNIMLQIVEYFCSLYANELILAEAKKTINKPCSLSLLEAAYFRPYDYKDKYYLLLDGEKKENETFINFKENITDGLLSDSSFGFLEIYLTTKSFVANFDWRTSNEEIADYIMCLFDDFGIKGINDSEFGEADYTLDYEDNKFGTMDTMEYLEVVGSSLYKQGYSLLDIWTGGDYFLLTVVKNSEAPRIVDLFNQLSEYRNTDDESLPETKICGL